MAPSNTETNTFLDISVCLTGFSQIELLSTGMLDIYYNVITSQNNLATVNQFLTDARTILDKYKNDQAQLQDAILNELLPDAYYNGLAKNIIRMWYMGNWNNAVISPQAYVQGLIWGVAGTHPPGAKQPGYASWNTAPINLNNQ